MLNYIEIFQNVMESAVCIWFLYKKFGDGKFTPLTFIAFVVYTGILTLSSYLGFTTIILLGISIPSLFLYTVLLSRKNYLSKIFFSTLTILLTGVADLLVVAVLSFISGASFDLLINTNLYRIQGAILARALLFVIFFFLTRRKSMDVIRGPLWALLYSIPVLCIIVLFIYIRYQVQTHGESMTSLILTFGLILISSASIYLYDRLSVYTEKAIQQEMMIQQMRAQQTYIEEIRRLNMELQGFRHDYANHIQALHGILEDGKVDNALEYIHEMEHVFDTNRIVINSGHASIDAIIGSKIARAIHMGIGVDYKVSLPDTLKIPVLELSSILGNLLDNAIEANEEIADKALSRILLEIGLFTTNITILVRNTYIEHTAKGGTRFLSRKKGVGHGIGLLNIRRLVAKNNGLMDIDTDGTMFTVRVLIPN